MVYTIKGAYSGEHVNVATWDADLRLDSMKCCGLAECGTAQSANGLEYAFAVFRGAGEIKWRGETWPPGTVHRNRVCACCQTGISYFWGDVNLGC